MADSSAATIPPRMELTLGDWLPIPTLARRVELPETTTRRYVQALADLLPQRKSGRLTLYDADVAEAILPRAAALFSEGHRLPEVKRVLAKEFSQVDDVASLPATTPPPQVEPMTNTLMESINVLRMDMATMGSALERVQGELRDERTARTVLAQENTAMAQKMLVLEAELVRLRKDRREMEKFLLAKIKGGASK